MLEDDIRKIAEGKGYQINEKNFDKIMKAKRNFFKDGNLLRCPCKAQDEEKYCGSEKCQAEILEKGHCCCNLFLRGKSDE